MRRASLLLVFTLLVAGCGSRVRSDGLPDIPPHQEAAKITVQREFVKAGRIDFRPAATRPAFLDAVAAFEREAHARRVPVAGIPGAVGFRVDSKSADASIEDWSREYRRRGAYVFRYDPTYGYSTAGDAIIVLPTHDQWLVVRAAATNGANYDILTPAVLRWLKRLDQRHPFTVYGAGIDFVEGRFAEAPHGAEAMRLARQMYRFSPDIVDQGTDTVPALAHELEQSGTLYLWWD